MKIINAIIQRLNRNDYRIILVYEDGTRHTLPSIMSLRTANVVRRNFIGLR